MSAFEILQRTLDAVRFTDSAYVDRADIVQYVGLPPREAIYWILQTCLQELMRAGIISRLVSGTFLYRTSAVLKLSI